MFIHHKNVRLPVVLPQNHGMAEPIHHFHFNVAVSFHSAFYYQVNTYSAVHCSDNHRSSADRKGTRFHFGSEHHLCEPLQFDGAANDEGPTIIWAATSFRIVVPQFYTQAGVRRES